MTPIHGDDDDPITPRAEDKGGPEAGEYQTDDSMDIPGEGSPIDNSQLG